MKQESEPGRLSLGGSNPRPMLGMKRKIAVDTASTRR